MPSGETSSSAQRAASAERGNSPRAARMRRSMRSPSPSDLELLARASPARSSASSSAALGLRRAARAESTSRGCTRSRAPSGPTTASALPSQAGRASDQAWGGFSSAGTGAPMRRHPSKACTSSRASHAARRRPSKSALAPSAGRLRATKMAARWAASAKAGRRGQRASQRGASAGRLVASVSVRGPSSSACTSPRNQASSNSRPRSAASKAGASSKASFQAGSGVRASWRLALRKVRMRASSGAAAFASRKGASQRRRRSTVGSLAVKRSGMGASPSSSASSESPVLRSGTVKVRFSLWRSCVSMPSATPRAAVVSWRARCTRTARRLATSSFPGWVRRVKRSGMAVPGFRASSNAFNTASRSETGRRSSQAPAWGQAPPSFARPRLGSEALSWAQSSFSQ